MLDDVAPFDAMKESFAICMANIVSVIVGFLCVGIAFFVLAIVIGWIPLLGALALGILGALIGGPSMYFAHRQVFGSSTPVQPPMAPPAPMDPPVPPAPPAA
jgi:uncharacterized membrane protein